MDRLHCPCITSAPETQDELFDTTAIYNRRICVWPVNGQLIEENQFSSISGLPSIYHWSSTAAAGEQTITSCRLVGTVWINRESCMTKPLRRRDCNKPTGFVNFLKPPSYLQRCKHLQ